MKTAPLGDIAQIISGATPKTGDDQFWGGEILWATPADLSKLDGPYISSTSRTITEAGLKSCAAQVLPVGSVLLSSRAPIGHVAINTEPMATNQGFKSLIPRPGVVDAKYLFHWLRTNTDYLQSLGNGATFKEVSKAVVSKVEVPLPPLDQQRRVAAILDKADAVLRMRRGSVDSLDELARSVYLEVSAEHGGAAEHALGDIAEVVTGFAFKSNEYVNDGTAAVRLCRGANVLPGRLDWSDLAQWPQEREDEFKKFNLSPGDVVVAMDRPWISEGFKIARVTEADCPALLVQRVARIRASGKINNEFIYAALNSPEFERYCRPTETTIPHISPIEIRGFPINVPSDVVLEKFAQSIKQIDILRDVSVRAVDEARAVFASLQHRAFAGQL